MALDALLRRVTVDLRGDNEVVCFTRLSFLGEHQFEVRERVAS